MWNLIVGGPNHPPQRRPLPNDGTLLIGRADDNEVVLSGESVSRRHAQLWVSHEGLQIADLGSRNGTWLNGRTLGSVPRPLQPGDVAAIGVYTLKVEKTRDKTSDSPTPDSFITLLGNVLGRDPNEPIGGPIRKGTPPGLKSEAQAADALGKLAVGVIQELNHPVQSIVDQARFLKDSVLEIARILGKDAAKPSSTAPAAPDDQSGIDDLVGEIPRAAAALIDEASRMQAFISAARDFSLLGEASTPTDPNRIVTSAVELVRGARSSVADFEFQLAQLGKATCNPRVLYLALFAIFESATSKLVPPKAGEKRCQIRVETSHEPEGVCIRVSSSIAESGAELFTTQVLNSSETALIASVEQLLREQGGALSVSSESGEGRVFRLRLPPPTNTRVTR